MKLKNLLNEAPKVKVDDGDPFPNMTKWWTYPKEKIMTFVYWTQRQMPPTNEKDYEENWQKVKSQLILRNPPPPNVQLESKLNEAPMDDRFAKEYEKSGNAIRNHIKHEFHIDDKIKHKVALFTVNTNNGYTEFENGEKIPSIENTLALFDGNVKHRSVVQTDENLRINININYDEEIWNN